MREEINDVTKQPHYTQFKIQPMQFIQVNNLGWCVGNVIKYTCRYKAKNGLEDLEKAKFYLDKLIEFEKTGDMVL